MQIEEKKIGKVLVVKILDQRMDARIAVEFKTKMTQIINEGNDLLVISLADVDFIDSSGLGAIVSVLKVLGKKGDIVISETKQPVMTMFKLTRMDKVFKMFENQTDAVNSINL
ncbi:STAS domain-containing protein [bacterium]|nr:STAS domain-containing protein [bacterium]